MSIPLLVVIAVVQLPLMVAFPVIIGLMFGGMRTLGLTWTELGLAIVGAASVWLSVRLREENSEPAL